MMDRLRNLGILSRDSEETDESSGSGAAFSALRLFSAEMSFLTGVNTTLHYLRARSPRSEADRVELREWDSTQHPDAEHQLPLAAVWAPLLVGSFAGAVQAAQAFRPADETHLLARVLNGIVLGLGAAGMAGSIAAAARGEQRLSLAPLMFGYTGLLGFLVDRQERMVAEEEAQLERRASIVERLVPRRRTRLEKVVVHV
jgi:hypothetical protein